MMMPIEKIYSAENIKKFVEDEMAVSIEDIFARRTRLLFLDARKAIAGSTDGCKSNGSCFTKRCRMDTNRN